MAEERTYLSALAWAVAGVPILATLFQTVLALLRTSGYAVLGGLVDALHSLAVFDAAAPVFRESTGVVLALFVLIAVGWAVQGAATFVARHRDAAFAAAGLTSMLFFALFLGVYAPLFDAGLPPAQVALFFGVPVVAAAAVVASALLHDWETDVVDAATAELVAAEEAVEDARGSFERAFDAAVGDLSTLRDAAPAAADAAGATREEFLGRCEAIAQELQALRDRDADPDVLRREANELRERAAALDPEAAADEAAAAARDELADAARTSFGSVQVFSRWDRSYRLVNLPARFREVHVGAFGTDVHVDHLADAVTSRLDDGVDVRTVVEGMAEIRAHLSRVESYLDEREAEFAAALDAADEDLATVESKVGGFDGAVGERLSEFLVDGRHEALAGVRDAREDLATARDALHDCRFDDADRAIGDARATGEDLVRLVEFLRAVAGSIEHGQSRVSLPDGVDPAVVRDLQPAFERAHGVSFDVREDRIELDGAASVDPEPDRESPSKSADDGPSARPEDVIDSVLYVVRELERAAGDTDGEIQLQTGELPGSVAEPAVLDHLETFAARQTDVVEAVEVQDGAPPGFLTVRPAEGTTPARAAGQLHERYRDRYGG